MINCEMVLEDTSMKLRARGHAGYAKRGKDIICAAASAICNTLVNYCEYRTQNAECKNAPHWSACDGSLTSRGILDFWYSLEPGKIDIDIEFEKGNKGILEVLSFVMVGFETLAISYPKYIRFSMR